MCGIAGKVNLAKTPVTEQMVAQMTNAIAHRGPDDAGVYVSPDKQVGLGHRRLAIIDLTKAGHQPMQYKNRYWIVFNGEVYNFQEKRELLEKEGYTFVSHTDTEVILALYDKYREKCVEHLRGMFAFAIYDAKEQVLFAARDRVGKKPFKYFWDGTTFLFGSELKAILTQPEYKKEIDYVAIHHYLTLQYCPAPLTGFKNISKLGAAHYLILNLKTKKLSTHRYWHLDYSHKLQLSEPEWCARILSKLEESVKLRMISDVPLGAFLSGGIDSSAVVAMMSKVSDKPVKTFSIGFNDPKYNELGYAKQVAQQFGTEHTEFVVEPKAIDVLPLLVKHYEEPYADSSALPTYYVSKLTRDHVTVALNGDGGDENFAGYSRYSVQKLGLQYEKIKHLHRAIASPALSLASKGIKNSLMERANRFSKTLPDSHSRRYTSYTAYFTQEQKADLYTPEFAAQMGEHDTYGLIAQQFALANTPDRFDQMLYADISSYLPDDLLAKVDIASMAVALEARSPFLDHEMLELTAQIPASLKLKGLGNKKYILKKALEGILPNDIMYRRKMGFSVPLDTWFRGELKDYIQDRLQSSPLFDLGIFNRSAVESLLAAHTTTNVNYANHLWALLTLAMWLETFFGDER